MLLVGDPRPGVPPGSATRSAQASMAAVNGGRASSNEANASWRCRSACAANQASASSATALCGVNSQIVIMHRPRTWGPGARFRAGRTAEAKRAARWLATLSSRARPARASPQSAVAQTLATRGNGASRIVVCLARLNTIGVTEPKPSMAATPAAASNSSDGALGTGAGVAITVVSPARSSPIRLRTMLRVRLASFLPPGGAGPRPAAPGIGLGATFPGLWLGSDPRQCEWGSSPSRRPAACLERPASASRCWSRCPLMAPPRTGTAPGCL